MPRSAWRIITDRAKRQDWPLRIADRLGRGHGRLRWLDFIASIPRAPLVPDLAGWADRTLSAVWIGHATVLLRIDGCTLLTDPAFHPRVGLGFGLVTAGPQRHVRPAIRLTDLPPVDIVLLSHAHFDHLDRPSLTRLSKRAHVVTFAGVGELIADLNFAHVTELRWGEAVRIGGLTITGLPVVHWGARTFLDTQRGYGAFLLDSSGPTHARHRVLFGGDSAYHEHWRGVGPVDLAIVGIGAYDPYLAAHATPEQASQMADHVDARHVLPAHHSTFTLSHEPLTEPIARMLAANQGRPARIVVRQVGGAWTEERPPR